MITPEQFAVYTARAGACVLAEATLDCHNWPEGRDAQTQFHVVEVADGETNARFHLIDPARGAYVADQQNKAFVMPLPQPSRVETHDECALLIGGQANHWHFLVNFVTRLLAARAVLGPELGGADTVLIHEPTVPQATFLARLFPNLRFRTIPNDTRLGHRFRRLLYPSFLHNVRLYGGPLAELGAAARAGFAKDPAFSSELPARIFVDRDPAIPRRRLAARHVAIPAIEAHGLVPVLNEYYDLAEQVALYSRARAVAGLHGAGMSNVIFCAPGTPVLILDYKWPSEMYGLARVMGLRPIPLVAEPQPDPGREQRLRDLKVPINQLLAALTLLRDLEP